MATSGSTDFTINRDQLIKDAMVLCGAIAQDETPTASEVNLASRQLNMMLKASMVDGLQIWQRKTKSITPVASQASYTLGPSGDVVMDRPQQILDLNYKETSSGTETPLFSISRQEYETLPNKTTSSTPNQYHFHPSTTNATLYVWPTADATFAANYTLEMVYQKPIDDMDTAANDFDVPLEWYEAILWGLARRLSIFYGTETTTKQQIYSNSREFYDRALNSVVEESVQFQPDLR